MADGLKFRRLFLFVILYTNARCSALSESHENYNRALKANRVYSQTFAYGTKTPVFHPRKVQLSMDIYCYEPFKSSFSLKRMWTTVYFSFRMNSTARYTLFSHGSDEPAVFSQRGQTKTGWMDIFSFSRTSNDLYLCPVQRSCVGIDTMDEYYVQLNVVDVDRQLLCCFLVGISLFFCAGAVSRSVVLYYFTGVSLGVLASILIICYLLSCLFPKKTSILALLLAAGSSVTLWILGSVWNNLSMLVNSHRNLIVAYIGVSAVISFAVCYYRGPITEPRMLDLIKWALQAFGLLLVYAGCQIPEVSGTVIVLLVTTYLLLSKCFK